MRKNKLIKEIEKYFVTVIKLCDNSAYTKSDIRQVVNAACTFLYNENQNSR